MVFISLADSSMFVLHSPHGSLILLLYVDDIILTGSNPCMLTNFVRILGTEFAVSNLGDMHFFLGI
jgi:hypothetical protein